MSDGIRSGVNWMRLEFKPEHRAERRDQLGLGKAGHADQQRVAAGENRKQRLFDNAFLAEDHLADFPADQGDFAECLFRGGDDRLFVNRAVCGLHHTHRLSPVAGNGCRIAKSALSVSVFQSKLCSVADKSPPKHYLVKPVVS